MTQHCWLSRSICSRNEYYRIRETAELSLNCTSKYAGYIISKFFEADSKSINLEKKQVEGGVRDNEVSGKQPELRSIFHLLTELFTQHGLL